MYCLFVQFKIKSWWSRRICKL